MLRPVRGIQSEMSCQVVERSWRQQGVLLEKVTTHTRINLSMLIPSTAIGLTRIVDLDGGSRPTNLSKAGVPDELSTKSRACTSADLPF